MNRLRRPVVSISALILIIAGIAGFACKFSFADNKRPDRGSVSFGNPSGKVETSSQLSSFKTIFADAAAKVIPTVVSVVITKFDTVVYAQNPFYQFGEDPFFFGSPFDFFNQPQQQQRMPRNRQQKPQQQFDIRKSSGLGSGVIVSKDGYILTNCHVVLGADEIVVKTSDGREFKAQIVGADTLSDVAVIKIKDKANDLAVATIGDSDKLRPGDWVMAVGNPFREYLSSTVTVGIVSAIKRALGRQDMPDQRMFQSYIQTDAAINPGNSGGALVNIDGDLVGINTMIFSGSGGNVGIGLAIPISMAKKVMEDLIYEGKVMRGYLGVNIQNLDAITREALGLTEATGVLIVNVTAGEAADKAGIKSKDIILTVNGNSVKNVDELRNLVASISPGTRVPVEILRNGGKKNLQVTIGTLDEKKLAMAGKKDGTEPDNNSNNTEVEKNIGISVGDLTADLRNQLDLDQSATGVVILSVEPNSIAAEQGLRANDIIHQINRDEILTARDFKRVVKQLKKGDAVAFWIERNGMSFVVPFRIKE